MLTFLHIYVETILTRTRSGSRTVDKAPDERPDRFYHMKWPSIRLPELPSQARLSSPAIQVRTLVVMIATPPSRTKACWKVKTATTSHNMVHY